MSVIEPSLTRAIPVVQPQPRRLSEALADYYADPLGFVLFAYPWGVPGGPLVQYDGPDDWQAAFLDDLGEMVRERAFDGKTPVAPIRMAVSSGNGTGKGVLAAWLINWIMSTRAHAQGMVTATTFPQLSSKTWSTLQTWTSRCITRNWFKLTGDTMYHIRYAPSWKVNAQTCREDNAESFGGLHAASSTPFQIFDEASGVPDRVWEFAEHGLTDGEPMWFVFGNSTRSNGRFHSVCFGAESSRWNVRTLDSRKCRFPNKQTIQEEIDYWGEDSDYVRVHVYGIPPRASDSQFIDLDRIHDAMKRHPAALPDDPLVVGVDLAWGGDDSNCVRFRRGLDAWSIPAVRIPGEKTRDPVVMVNRLGDILTREYNGVKVKHMFVDSAGIAGSVVYRLRQLGHQNVTEVNYAADSPDPKYANWRAFMWGKGKDWLLAGGIPNDNKMEYDLTCPGYKHDKQIRVLLEPKDLIKKRLGRSPDDADALFLTFAMPVLPARPKPKNPPLPRGVGMWS